MAVKTTIEVSDSAIEGDYIILTLDSIGANISRKVGKGAGTERTLWATFSPPQNKELKIAVPTQAGAGPAPEDTLTLLAIDDLAHHIVATLEESLDARELSIKEKQKEKGW